MLPHRRMRITHVGCSLLRRGLDEERAPCATRAARRLRSGRPTLKVSGWRLTSWASRSRPFASRSPRSKNVPMRWKSAAGSRVSGGSSSGSPSTSKHPRRQPKSETPNAIAVILDALGRSWKAYFGFLIMKYSLRFGAAAPGPAVRRRCRDRTIAAHGCS